MCERWKGDDKEVCSNSVLVGTKNLCNTGQHIATYPSSLRRLFGHDQLLSGVMAYNGRNGGVVPDWSLECGSSLNGKAKLQPQKLGGNRFYARHFHHPCCVISSDIINL